MARVKDVLDEFIRKRILIVGEITAAKCSECKDGNKSKVWPASAALMALYAAKLGANVTLVGSIGPGDTGKSILASLKENDVNISGITKDPLKPTLCWKKMFNGNGKNSSNIITEKQILDSTLKHTANNRAFLYISQNPSSFSTKLYEEIIRAGKGLRIPIVVFSSYPLPKPLVASQKNDLLIAHNHNGTVIGKNICLKSNSGHCLIINKNNEYSLISRSAVQYCQNKSKSDLYQYEAALSVLSTLLLGCHKFPDFLPALTKNMHLSSSSISIDY